MESGCAEGLRRVLAPKALQNAASARIDADSGAARLGLMELIQGVRLAEAQKIYEAQPNDENLVRLRECREAAYRRFRQSL